MTNRYYKAPLFFSLGGLGYVGLELLWRGWSHYSMFLAGGSCFLLLGKLEKKPLSRGTKLAAGAGIITAVELAAGLLFNRDYQVWDYRDLPLNFLGQICAPFTALWIPVGGGAMALHRKLEEALRDGRRRPGKA